MESKPSHAVSNHQPDSAAGGDTRLDPRLTLPRPRVHILARSSRSSSAGVTVVSRSNPPEPRPASRSVRVSTASRNLLKDFKHVTSSVASSSERTCANKITRSDLVSVGVINVNSSHRRTSGYSSQPGPPTTTKANSSFSTPPRCRKSRLEVLLSDDEIDEENVHLRCDPNLNTVSFTGRSNTTLSRAEGSDTPNSHDIPAGRLDKLHHRERVLSGCASDDEYDMSGTPACPDSGFGLELSDSSGSLMDVDMMSLFSGVSSSNSSSSSRGSLSPSPWEEAIDFSSSPLMADTPDGVVGEDAADFPDDFPARTSKNWDIPGSSSSKRRHVDLGSDFEPNVGLRRGSAASRRTGQAVSGAGSGSVAVSAVSAGMDVRDQTGSLETVWTTSITEASPDSGIDSPLGKQIEVVRALWSCMVVLKIAFRLNNFSIGDFNPTLQSLSEM
ncbi:hypothetical protein RRG08_063422 [Elysia crispata]|uniref:Uncharacterized protein n=1 Tax=Elysia crispata TaxID=231223 RepID=A0AAE1AA31_9GAST|nr:hypothetical protein RRG08_063422 [Elysia crispata]